MALDVSVFHKKSECKEICVAKCKMPHVFFIAAQGRRKISMKFATDMKRTPGARSARPDAEE